jgi:hypothetical protein
MEDLIPPSVPPPRSREDARYVQIWVDRDLLTDPNRAENPPSKSLEVGELMLRLLMLEREFLQYSETVSSDKRYYLGKAKGISDAMKVVQQWKGEQ